MSLDHYRRQVIQIRKNLAKLQGDKSTAAAKASEASKKAHLAVAAAKKANSISISNTKQREADRHFNDEVKALKAISGIENKIATEQKKLIDVENNVTREQERELKKQADLLKREEKTRLYAEERKARNYEIRMNEFRSKLTSHDSLHAETASRLEKLSRLPEKITVAFFASDPASSAESRLALDVEARSIQEKIRASEHRDAVKLESRWAVRPMDILQAINELKPKVVHFSGHGSDNDELILQDENGKPEFVSMDAIVKTISVASDTVELIFFNTCFSYAQAKECVEHVKAAIGMNAAIGDDAARVFSAQFYSAIGFGLSIPRAFAQAQAALMMEDIDQGSTPELYLRENVDEDDLVLVRPVNAD